MMKQLFHFSRTPLLILLPKINTSQDCHHVNRRNSAIDNSEDYSYIKKSVCSQRAEKKFFPDLFAAKFFFYMLSCKMIIILGKKRSSE